MPATDFDSVEARLAKQALLATIATRFLSIPPEQVDRAVCDTLSAIGRFAGADRAGLALYHEDGEHWSLNHEWHREGLSPLRGILEHLAPFRWGHTQMLADRTISIRHPGELPREAANDALLLRGLDLCAYLQIPVHVGGRLLGFASLACTQPRETPWPEAFRALLALPGRMMGYALAHRASEQRLRESRARWRSLCDSNVVGVFVMRREDGTIVESNEAGLRILGRDAAELASGGIALGSCTPPEDLPQDRRMLEILDRTGRVLPYEKHALRPDGTKVPVLATLTSLAPASDQLLSVCLDLGSRRRVEEELRRRDEIDRVHAELSRALIDMPAASIEDAVCEGMGSIARHFGFDAATLFDVEPGADVATRRTYWRGDPRLPPMNPEATVPLSRLPWWRDRLRSGRTTSVPELSAFPPQARAERDLFEAIGLQAAVSVPLVPGGVLRGILVFVCRHPLRLADDELAVLRVFGDIAANALERARIDAEIAAAVATLERRVDQRLAQLEASNAELEAFAYSVSHDLRAPLRTIDGMSQVLREDFATELGPEAVALLERIQSATRRMAHLIDGLLQLSRVVRTEMEWKQIDLSALAGEIVEELARACTGRRLDVVVEPGIVATGHPRLLRIALEQLLENALKFTRGRDVARIEVSSSRDAEGLVVSVHDNGVGFDPGFAAKLFGAFQRLHGVEEFEGHGIGLATVDRIVRLHGGSAVAEGRPGEGATFRITIPVRPEALP